MLDQNGASRECEYLSIPLAQKSAHKDSATSDALKERLMTNKIIRTRKFNEYATERDERYEEVS